MKAITPFEVEIADGRVFTVPADKTIVEVLEDNDVDVMFDCARGDCGICQTDVISGTPDHRDVVLSEAERAAKARSCRFASAGPNRRGWFWISREEK